MTSRNEILTNRAEQSLLNVYGHPFSIAIERGQGCYVFDSDGNRYLDCASGIGANVLGYGHPVLLEAVISQASCLMHASNLFLTERQVELAERLCEVTGMDKAFFANSGAESIDTAIKLARRWGSVSERARDEIICFREGWHGRSIAAISACESDSMQRGFGPLVPGFKAVDKFDIQQIDAALSDRTVAVLIEPILGHGGIFPAPPGFLSTLRRLCDKSNLLLILDEVQSGVGRTGSFLYSQKENISADILTLGKGLGGGVPISAVMCADRVASVMEPGSHGSTFGGNALSCRAASAVLSVVTRDGFLQEVSAKGAYLLKGLESLTKKHTSVFGEARGAGLLSGVEVKCDRENFQRSLACEGVIATSLAPNFIRILPPLVISIEEIDTVLDAVDRAALKFA